MLKVFRLADFLRSLDLVSKDLGPDITELIGNIIKAKIFVEENKILGVTPIDSHAYDGIADPNSKDTLVPPTQIIYSSNPDIDKRIVEIMASKKVLRKNKIFGGGIDAGTYDGIPNPNGED